MPLTRRQREVLCFIREVQLRHMTGPSTRAIHQRFCFGSQTAAVNHIRALVAKGVVIKVDGEVRLSPKLRIEGPLVHVPIFGSISAGIPEFVEESAEGYVPIDVNAVGVAPHGKFFATRVRGESMIGATLRRVTSPCLKSASRDQARLSRR